LGLIGTRSRGSRARLAAALVGLLALGAAATATGLPARLLLLPNWPELIDGISRGLAGIEDNELPYAGADEWLRLTLLLFAPVLVCLAAVVGFWPARRRGPLRVLALAALVTLYGVAVTLDSPGAELLWGVALTVLAAAWLWLPRLASRDALVATVVVAVAGLFALPAAAAIDPERPIWDYENWDWFAVDSAVSFEWDHTYGPLDWQREGTTLLEVRSNLPLYWKASVLDRFDGFTWQRAARGDALARREFLARLKVPGNELPDVRREWLTQASFEVAALSSELVIGMGLPQAQQGVEDVIGSPDGTLVKGGAALETGDEYSVVAYAPRPTEAELREAPDRYPRRWFDEQTLLSLPTGVGGVPEVGPTGSTAGAGAEADAPTPPTFGISEAIAMPLWGDRDPEVEAALRASPYAGTYALARRLTADAETPHEATEAIEAHLRESYDYTPDVPQDTYPLRSFLFEDQAGYCQQFAGSMALMLRMVGIPARVVSGFAPGSFDAERGVYEVRDLDAHAWVEVYFRRIGWVTFDPTPAAAPASSQADNEDSATFLRGRSSVDEQGIGRGRALERGLEGGVLPEGPASSGPWAEIGLVLAAVAVAVGAIGAVVAGRRRRRLARGELVDAQLAELRGALERLGWSLPRDLTLLALEQRFRSAGRRPVAAYAAGLRRHRYAGSTSPPPGPAERRALRRALGSGGLGRRLRGLLAIPPGGPRG
jgi:transglutaminase-like putative cysteine protease